MFPNFVGNSRIVSALRRMLAEGRLPQTLLFTGPRGVGKATLAGLLAASLNCLYRAPGEACGECSNCRRILVGGPLPGIFPATLRRAIKVARRQAYRKSADCFLRIPIF